MKIPFERPCFKRYYCARRALPSPSGLYDFARTVGFHYGREYGVLLEDVDEIQMLLIFLLDGHYSYPEIVALLQDCDPNVTAQYVSEALNDLIHFGLSEGDGVDPGDGEIAELAWTSEAFWLRYPKLVVFIFVFLQHSHSEEERKW